jgi:hypothetical protein
MADEVFKKTIRLFYIYLTSFFQIIGHPNPNGNEYPHLPAHLQAWAAAIPPPPQPVAREGG